MSEHIIIVDPGWILIAFIIGFLLGLIYGLYLKKEDQKHE